MKQNFIVVQTDLNWLFIFPKGIHLLMAHIKDKYKNLPIYITENGKYTIQYSTSFWLVIRLSKINSYHYFLSPD